MKGFIAARLFLLVMLFFSCAAFSSFAQAKTFDFNENLVDEVIDCVLRNEIDDETILMAKSLSLLEREMVTGSLREDLDDQEIEDVFSAIFDVPENDEPGMDGFSNIPYSYRYLIYDRNEGDYDYIYVFRLNTLACPAYYEHYYVYKYWWCSLQRWYSVSFWQSYVKNGSLYYEFLVGKRSMDAWSCYGYMEMRTWY